MIEMNKCYKTKSGYSIRIITTDLKNTYPVVGVFTDSEGSESIWQWTKTGKYYREDTDHSLDLVEYNPAEDLKVDDRILVKGNCSGGAWVPRHFSHIGDNGKVHAFLDGRTSFTTKNTTIWNQWKYPE